jgi:perosamine synthetase
VEIIPWASPTFFGYEEKYVSDAVKSTWISDGKYIKQFESKFSKSISSEHILTTSNGTTALHLANLMLGLGKGDEVIVPGFGFVAPINMVLAVGATPIYADIDSDTWCIDPKSIEKLITTHTKAIIPVHTYGNVCDMDAIMKIAKQHNLYVIEDTAEALFSKYNGKMAGTIGDIGCFSFQATKTITMGEGGAISIQKIELVKKAQQLKSHGMKDGKRYWHEIVAYNFRLTNMQAAMGCAQLEFLSNIIEMKKKVYAIYKKELDNIDGIKLQKFNKEVDPVVWAIALQIDEKIFNKTRDEIMELLYIDGIETRPGFYDCAILPIYNASNIPNSQFVSKSVISLPSSTNISEDEIRYICKKLKKLRIVDEV